MRRTTASWAPSGRTTTLLPRVGSARTLSGRPGPRRGGGGRTPPPAARRAAAGAFNFNLSFWLLYLLSWLLIFTVIGAVIGIPLIIALFLVSAWCHIKGAVRAADDRPYEYPFQIRVLS